MAANKKDDDAFLDQWIWGARDIGQECGLEQRQAFHALENGSLPGKKIGGRWASTRRLLRGVFESVDA